MKQIVMCLLTLSLFLGCSKDKKNSPTGPDSDIPDGTFNAQIFHNETLLTDKFKIAIATTNAEKVYDAPIDIESMVETQDGFEYEIKIKIKSRLSEGYEGYKAGEIKLGQGYDLSIYLKIPNVRPVKFNEYVANWLSTHPLTQYTYNALNVWVNGHFAWKSQDNLAPGTNKSLYAQGFFYTHLHDNTEIFYTEMDEYYYWSNKIPQPPVGEVVSGELYEINKNRISGNLHVKFFDGTETYEIRNCLFNLSLK